MASEEDKENICDGMLYCARHEFMIPKSAKTG
jgi:hypothetical protein